MADFYSSEARTLQKAFDTVDHGILLTKLDAIGVDNIGLKWFSSYLKGRKQFVDISNISSPQENVTCGVPQGSILGPLLFTIYVNDMCSAINSDLCLYADDSMLITSGKDVKCIERTLKSEMDNINDCLVQNRLSLHLVKTETILCGSKKKLRKVSKMSICCNGVQLEARKSVKYLGATIDQDLSGSTMGENVIKKVNGVLKYLCIVKETTSMTNVKNYCIPH